MKRKVQLIIAYKNGEEYSLDIHFIEVTMNARYSLNGAGSLSIREMCLCSLC